MQALGVHLCFSLGAVASARGLLGDRLPVSFLVLAATTLALALHPILPEAKGLPHPALAAFGGSLLGLCLSLPLAAFQEGVLRPLRSLGGAADWAQMAFWIQLLLAWELGLGAEILRACPRLIETLAEAELSLGLGISLATTLGELVVGAFVAGWIPGLALFLAWKILVSLRFRGRGVEAQFLRPILFLGGIFLLLISVQMRSRAGIHEIQAAGLRILDGG